MALDPADIRIDVTRDEPEHGQRVGTQNCWVTATHLPTRAAVRTYGRQQYRARNLALMLLEMAIAEMDEPECGHPSRVYEGK